MPGVRLLCGPGKKCKLVPKPVNAEQRSPFTMRRTHLSITRPSPDRLPHPFQITALLGQIMIAHRFVQAGNAPENLEPHSLGQRPVVEMTGFDFPEVNDFINDERSND